MELNLRKDATLREDCVSIEYKEMSHTIASIVEICGGLHSIIASDGNKTHQIDINDIFYIEWVDNKSCICTENSIYTIAETLKTLEQQLGAYGFVRSSKAQIVNTHKLKCISSGLNMKLTVELRTGEKLEISRHYRSMIIDKIHETAKERR